MSKMTEEVTRAIATKFLTHPEEFELIKRENYKNYVVYFAAYKLASGNSYNGLPIYILIDELGKARYATSEERDEIWHRNDPELEEDEDEEVEKEEDDEEEGYIELPPM
ncbi:hypothetical protein [Bacteroides ovatus]|uniref:hypothetical protein n=1 Tax=Bacteroides ovatus TaxID=28116 RepID=UPI0018F5DF33|nr:hypothetical protein [Bacteroides ovatus]CAG9924481.1 hypothetical protein BOVA208_2166 [Bacteroides ovatus]